MDWLKFISEMTASLAWPVAAVTVVCVFRRGILQRLPDLSKLSLPGGISAEFTNELESVEAVIADRAIDADAAGGSSAPAIVIPAEPSQANGQIARTTASTVDVRDQVDKVPDVDRVNVPAEAMPDNFVLFLKPTVARNISEKISLQANPTGVVMEAWKGLESTLRDLAAKSMPQNVKLSRKLGILQVFDLLNRKGITSVTETDALRRMLAMRNLAAHADDPISDDSAKRFQEIAEALTDNYRNKLAEAPPPPHASGTDTPP